jgi:hypothetical protein
MPCLSDQGKPSRAVLHGVRVEVSRYASPKAPSFALQHPPLGPAQAPPEELGAGGCAGQLYKELDCVFLELDRYNTQLLYATGAS